MVPPRSRCDFSRRHLVSWIFDFRQKSPAVNRQGAGGEASDAREDIVG
jgi:hypothetical protein